MNLKINLSKLLKMKKERRKEETSIFEVKYSGKCLLTVSTQTGVVDMTKVVPGVAAELHNLRVT